ncbi:MAG: metallophosphoesterase [Candidatus Helarchaeota archaeon]
MLNASLTNFNKIVKYLVIMMGFGSAAFLIIVSAISLAFISQYIEAYEVPLTLSIIGVVLAIFLTFALGRSKKLKEWFQGKKLNLRWLLITLISLAFPLTLLIIYVIPIDFNNFILESTPTFHFLLVSVSTLIFLVAGYLLYFSIESIKMSKLKKIKFSLFAIFTTFILIIFTLGFSFLYTNIITFPPANILSGNGHNDGPWLTWYNNKPNESICISWLTAQSNSSIVYYGTNPSALNHTAIGTGTYLHKVYLDGLTPNTTYFYYIPENFEQNHASNIFNFTTAASNPGPFKFAIVGDMQPTNQLMMNKCAMVADGLIREQFDFICQMGDMADDGSNPEDWHRLFNSLARIGANTPIQAVIGNHDWDSFIGSSNWGELFSYPYSNPSMGRYYSFDYYNAHFVMIDNFEHIYLMSQTQLNWIREDIQQARANGQDWIFCFFHLSMITSATSSMFWNLQRNLIPLFDELAVDAVFFAHDHYYEHFNYTYGWNGLLYDKTHDWSHNAIQYFCTGGGGANLEVSYGVLDPNRMATTTTVRWWDENLNQYRDVTYERRPWNASRYLTHAGFPENYTHWAPEDLGKYYYHLPTEEAYHDAWQQFGLQYGEQCYHYIQVEVNGKNCTISVRYPNGALLQGPGDAYPQQWTFQK